MKTKNNLIKLQSKTLLLYLILLAFMLPGCEEKSIEVEKIHYWVFDLDDGEKITTGQGNDQLTITARFLIRGYLESPTPDGNWEYDLIMYTHLDMHENVPEAQGYFSSEIEYYTFNENLPKLTLGILDAATGVSYHYGFTANKLPYFILNPGPYYIETRADDGTKFTDQGTDYFMTCFPNYLSLHIGGPSPENCNVLRAIVDMYDEAEKSIKNITLHGNLYKFDSFEEMNSWLDNHPQVNYLESPELIPF